MRSGAGLVLGRDDWAGWAAGGQRKRGRGEGSATEYTIQAIQAMEAAWRYGVLVLGWRV